MPLHSAKWSLTVYAWKHWIVKQSKSKYSFVYWDQLSKLIFMGEKGREQAVCVEDEKLETLFMHLVVHRK